MLGVEGDGYVGITLRRRRVIFCHSDETELRAIRDILELLGEASGLHTNFAKCSVSPIACSEEEADGAATVMECQLAPFPVNCGRA
jgi:hypothetical protein